jgi:hypothetical protein
MRIRLVVYVAESGLVAPPGAAQVASFSRIDLMKSVPMCRLVSRSFVRCAPFLPPKQKNAIKLNA